MSLDPRVVRVAVPTPLRRHFDYRLGPTVPVSPGVRLSVPFGRRRLVGVALEIAGHSDLPRSRLKPVHEVLDTEPLFPAELFGVLRWAAGYYHHPVGEVLAAALPAALRRGQPPHAPATEYWSLTAAGAGADPADLERAPLQQRLLRQLLAGDGRASADALRAVSPRWRTAARALAGRGWLVREERPCLEGRSGGVDAGPEPNPAQATALAAIGAARGRYQGFLLYGVTGSGKTEVYLRAIEQVLAAGRQALVLVPEIGLTPQLVRRFRRRFAAPIAVMHSGLTDTERLCAWTMARSGEAPIVLGTRSAVFTPLKHPGLIVVDEEHDGSYKQQDGFRYHARDLAAMRALREQVPLVLGSATPSLESLHNVNQGRLDLLHLPARTGEAALPAVHLLDLRRLPVEDGLSRPLVQALADRLAKGEQSLLFLNRRGFAPVFMCYDCGWLAPCQRCDARLTLHRSRGRLRCHHCGADAPQPERCAACGGDNLHGIGEGTERIEQALARRFPEARLVRIDRDTTALKGSLEESLRRVHAGEADILIGTQMLAKGHHFPAVTLVGIINADQGLYGVDFRAPEHLVQRILQVAGRAGRGARPGQVLIQTHHPDSPYFAALVDHDYSGFVDYALAERREARLAPFSHLALVRAEAPGAEAPLAFLRAVRAMGEQLLPGLGLAAEAVELLDPVPSPMERRAGRYRAQLLIQSARRRDLHRFLDALVGRIEGDRATRRVRWSLDVDPMDMY